MDFDVARARLIKKISAEISDKRVLDVMSRIPRELFVPKDRRHQAYEDIPLPIGWQQTISQPYIIALMTEALETKGTEKVLEIGTGSGYQTAILAELAKEVISIERVPALAESARALLDSLGHLWREEAPGAVEHQRYPADARAHLLDELLGPDCGCDAAHGGI